ncbi:hypothetical protein ATE92_2121 [Ulvibacter sp. MAR_2010_11]|uniref:adenylosuccinate lyase n=1 Tax=Ulvibacter sp. MAR_2010_11 TaxID=1250229 RepID=UPI000C2C7410|nr:adenylosuccinate lyase [Ulvibacter sp. MAR_2010_11]PKA83952.1 hypothetical protein ATE92_2121 [Ulvibacter sp. MAR_2010_11]
MASEVLFEKLSYTKAYRQTRLDVAQWVLDHPESFPDLLEYCFLDKTEISYKASWILEFVCLEKLSLLYPHLDFYFEHLPHVVRDQALRPLAKICEMLAVAHYKEDDPKLRNNFTAAHKKVMTECCFDWLLTEQKVACKAYAMTALYFLGTAYKWIHPELQHIINENIHQNTAAYKARGKNTLQKIERFQKKQQQSQT